MSNEKSTGIRIPLPPEPFPDVVFERVEARHVRARSTVEADESFNPFDHGRTSSKRSASLKSDSESSPITTTANKSIDGPKRTTTNVYLVGKKYAYVLIPHKKTIPLAKGEKGRIYYAQLFHYTKNLPPDDENNDINGNHDSQPMQIDDTNLGDDNDDQEAMDVDLQDSQDQSKSRRRFRLRPRRTKHQQQEQLKENPPQKQQRKRFRDHLNFRRTTSQQSSKDPPSQNNVNASTTSKISSPPPTIGGGGTTTVAAAAASNKKPSQLVALRTTGSNRALSSSSSSLQHASYMFDPTLFVQPTSTLVVIKKCFKNYPWYSENPHHEVAAPHLLSMFQQEQQQSHKHPLFDNSHFLNVIEALQDDRYFYIITPFVGPDLCDILFSMGTTTTQSDPGSTDFRQQQHQLGMAMASTLLTLKQACLVHRDISPENFIVHEQNLQQQQPSTSQITTPLIDFAMSLRIPTLEQHMQLIQSQSPPCGKLPYMSPEIALEQDFDTNVDTWALACILFQVWTCTFPSFDGRVGIQYLYQVIGDRSWKFWIRDGGLLVSDLDQIQQQLSQPTTEESLPQDYIIISTQIPLIQRLSTPQRHLLNQMLAMDPLQRLSMEQVVQILQHYEEFYLKETK